ncbi:MAG: hypothetical protein R6V10_09075 [bacterium]
MASNLMIRVIWNSSCEEVLGWKCVNLMDMNLEVHVHNRGRDVIHLRSEIELSGNKGAERLDNLYPHGVHPLGPDQTMSFYCSSDDARLELYSNISVFDAKGRAYKAVITGHMEEAFYS